MIGNSCGIIMVLKPKFEGVLRLAKAKHSLCCMEPSQLKVVSFHFFKFNIPLLPFSGKDKNNDSLNDKTSKADNFA